MSAVISFLKEEVGLELMLNLKSTTMVRSSLHSFKTAQAMGATLRQIHSSISFSHPRFTIR
jgi:hypothetical protein